MNGEIYKIQNSAPAPCEELMRTLELLVQAYRKTGNHKFVPAILRTANKIHRTIDAELLFLTANSLSE